MTEKSPQDIFGARTDLSGLSQAVDRIRESIAKVVVGQSAIVDQLIVALLANGHVLIEGVPGVAKTLMAKLMARSLDIPFSRIQFTPDLMPSDVVGTSVFHPGESRFEFRRGPVFSGIVLIDEINRSPAKTQSALFEVMEERQVTVDGQTYPMQHPFMVLATQNPVEHEGTYRLPEAQLDRFLFKLQVEFPTADDLHTILDRTTGWTEPKISPVMDRGGLMQLRQLAMDVPIAKHVQDYAVRIVLATHPEQKQAPEVARRYLRVGASPRGAQAIVVAAKVRAILDGRFAVSADDIKKVAHPALRHRIIRNFEGEAESVSPDSILDEVMRVTKETA